jgi:hypothetical protein
MTVAGVTCLLIPRRQLFSQSNGASGDGGSAEKTKGAEVTEASPLEQVKTNVVEDKPTKEKGAGDAPVAKSSISVGSLDASIGRAAGWLAGRYTIMKVPRFPLYYTYGLERVMALLNFDKLGGRDWYADGVAELLAIQKSDGSWDIGEGGNLANTCFAVLFLTRATWKKLGKPRALDSLGGGLQEGGRDLKKLAAGAATELDEQGNAKVPSASGPIDQLIEDILKSKDNKVVNDQAVKELREQAILKAFQGKSEDLIRNKDAIRELVAHPNPEARRTALWALGRCEDLGMVPLMIKALQDEYLDVVIEAQNALCMLSRRPRGFGLPLHPWDDLPEDASEDAKQKAVQQWREAQIDKWKKWYARVRPYDQRDDLTDVGKL